MGGYHQLPVTPFNPQPQESPVEQYSRLQQLAGMQQERQLRDQQLQQSQIQTQLMQQQQKDSQLYGKAMLDWDGKDPSALIKNFVSQGGSGQGAMSLQQKVLERQQTISKIAADDATTGAKNLETLKGKNDLIAGKIGAVLAQSDEQLPTSLISTAHELANTPGPDGKPLLDPQHVQAAQQIAQAGDPKQMRQQLQILQKSYMGDSAQIEATQKSAQAEKEKSDTAKNNAELAYYQKNGGAPGVPAETVQMNDWLSKPENKGKGPADFLKYKATLVPQFNFNLQNTGTTGNAADVAKRFGLTQEAFDQQSEKYYSTGQLPPAGRGGPALAMNKAIMNRAAELHPGASLAANSAEYKANEQSLKHLQTSFDQVTAFENTAIKNLDQVAEAGKKIPDLSARFANVPVRAISANMIGTPEMARFKTALLTAQTEAAKVLSSANANGVLSDSARHEAQDILDGNLPFPAMMSSINQLKTDFGNRHQSYADQITDIKGRLGGKAPTSPATTSSNLPNGAGKVIDKATAKQFYDAAGGDPDKARQLAIQNNWKVQ